MRYIYAVSYTHLDVYKRQQYNPLYGDSQLLTGGSAPIISPPASLSAFRIYFTIMDQFNFNSVFQAYVFERVAIFLVTYVLFNSRGLTGVMKFVPQYYCYLTK